MAAFLPISIQKEVIRSKHTATGHYQNKHLSTPAIAKFLLGQ